MNEEEKIEPDGPVTGNANEPPVLQGQPPATPIALEETTAVKPPEPITEPMEVHHHTHPAHGKKTWRSYFWEFLMLFLAVFCGFLAEYKLEHVIEHQREKQYVESLIDDLKSDQLTLSSHMILLAKGISMLDTLTTILNEVNGIENQTGHLYYLARLAPRLQPLSTNNRTFEQLKNSGNFRLIRKLEASNKIMGYYENFPLIRMLEGMNEIEFTEYKRLAAKIFDPLVFIQMEGEGDEIRRTTENPPVRTMDREIFKELSVFGVYMRGTAKGIRRADEELKREGAELISYLQQEYKLQ
jgi:hypothetical protein